MQTALAPDLFTDALRNELVLLRMGITVLSGLTDNVEIPRKISPSAISNVTEVAPLTESQPNTAKLLLSPKRCGSFIDASKQAMIQSAVQLEAMLMQDPLSGVAVRLEDDAFNASGTAPAKRGIRNVAGIGAAIAGVNGATVAWQQFLDLEASCTSANAATTDLAGYVTNHKLRSRAKSVSRGTNLDFIIAPDAPIQADGVTRVNGYRTAFTNAIPSNLVKGSSGTVCSAAIFSSDWSMAVLGLFGAPDLVVDPYTLSSTGQVRITLNQYVDFGVRQPAAFSLIADLLTT